MKAEVYYFSGTGNSLFIARELAASLQAALIPIASTRHLQEIRTTAEVVGIVFPVYYGGLPRIIRHFAGRLRDMDGKFVFAVCNYGGAAGGTLRSLARMLTANGGRLSAGYGIHMPQNAFRKPREKTEQLLAECRERLVSMATDVRAKKAGLFMASPLLELIGTPLYSLLKPLYTKEFQKLTGAPPSTSIDQMTAMLDQSFAANERCTGCGICQQVCPVGNIALDKGRPTWQNHCENCLACYNWCPNRAITGGPTGKGYFYRHPDIRLAEMLSAPPKQPTP